jgi:signal transduction histidine kinase
MKNPKKENKIGENKADTPRNPAIKLFSKKHGSLRLQMTFVFIALTALCILVSIAAANFFLEGYYKNTQIEKIADDFEKIEELVQGDVAGLEDGQTLDEATIKTLDRYSVTDNIKIVIFDTSSESNYIYTTETSPQQKTRIVGDLKEYILESYGGEAPELLLEEDNYSIFLKNDTYISSENIDLIGKLDTGVLCFIRMNYESIEETASIANNFYAYVGILMILIEAILIMFLLKKFTQPILSMNKAAKQMKNLDFDVKAECNSNNELGELSASLNSLSETLEETILELKKANNELKVDLNRRVEIDEMRKDFLGNVSHELKTPIAIIEGYAEGLKEIVNEDPESRDYYCDVIIDEAVKMNEMVKKLLALNKIEYGESQLEMERFDVAEMIRDILKSSEILAGDRDIRVVFEQTEPLYVYADEYMIEESITNYVSNAYHHVTGENTIVVKTQKHDGRVRVSVFNTGNQIPEDAIEKVWIKFFKVDKARTREYGGSGIGLSIVKAVMDLHNQKCGVLNHEDGVEFWLELDNSPVEVENLEETLIDSDN